jgi:hypothetical protein
MVLETRIGHDVGCPTCAGTGRISKSWPAGIGPGTVDRFAGTGIFTNR